MKIAYYTTDNTGAGSIIRGLALKFALERTGKPFEFRVFACAPPKAFDGMYSTHKNNELTEKLITEFAPDLIIVNLCWALLPLNLKAEKWVILRSVPKFWLEGNFDAFNYSRVIAIEPFDLPVRAGVNIETIEPVVCDNGDQSVEPPSACVVAHCGKPRESYELVMLAKQDGFSPIVFDLHSRQEPWRSVTPALRAAQKVYIGGGYNAVWESKLFGYDSRCKMVPFPRQWDNQAARIEVAKTYQIKENGADILAAQILKG